MMFKTVFELWANKLTLESFLILHTPMSSAKTEREVTESRLRRRLGAAGVLAKICTEQKASCASAF